MSPSVIVVSPQHWAKPNSKSFTAFGTSSSPQRKMLRGLRAGYRILVPCHSALRGLSLQAPSNGGPLCSSLFAPRANPRASRARVGGRERARGHMRRLHVDRCFLLLFRHCLDGQQRIRARCDGCWVRARPLFDCCRLCVELPARLLVRSSRSAMVLRAMFQTVFAYNSANE